MANTIILVDRRDDPIKRANVTLVWKGGGYDHLQVDESGRGQFYGSGTILEVRIASEKIPVSKKVNGSTTFVAQSDRSH